MSVHTEGSSWVWWTSKCTRKKTCSQSVGIASLPVSIGKSGPRSILRWSQMATTTCTSHKIALASSIRCASASCTITLKRPSLSSRMALSKALFSQTSRAGWPHPLTSFWTQPRALSRSWRCASPCPITKSKYLIRISIESFYCKIDFCYF